MGEIMKGFIFISLFFSLFFSSAFACENYQGQSFCVGDRAIADNADGSIVGVSKSKISIDFTGGSTTKKGVATFDISKVYLGKECSGDFCVNDKAVGGNLEGVIVGVSKDGVAINHKKESDKYSVIKTYQQKDSLVRKGCVEAYCANDSAVYKSFDGVIVGVNSKSSLVAISFVGGTSKYTGVGTYALKTVGVAKGCFQGYCYGDRAVSGSLDGVIVAVNPYRGQVSVQGKINGKTAIVTDDLKNVTMRSLSENVHANDSKRMINTLSDFNHSFR